MNLHFKSIDKNNLSEVLSLKIRSDQEGFIESVDECIEEARSASNWRTLAIYSGSEVVGFTMYGYFENEGYYGRVWLDRILIDYRYQGKGYGKKSVVYLIKRLFDEYNCNEIYLSVYDYNKFAIRLYESIGFKFNGEVDSKGEKVMVIKRGM
ncbi:MAG: GNAT family N-acetyltransferase [Clostridium sp.]|uniref:GNAT family N-acetyltransferase n=1 Tax=Clostridium sp. TaxID=1506 RepID=UPI002FC8627D